MKRFDSLKIVLPFFDAIGLGVFTAVGANAAISLDYSQPFLIVAMGLVTGIGGGVLRDVFVKEIPLVFRKEIYGIASIAGSLVLILTNDFLPLMISLYLCFIMTFAIRMLALKWKWNVPVVTKRTKIKKYDQVLSSFSIRDIACQNYSQC